MPQKPQPERSESEEGHEKHSKSLEKFRVLAKKLINISRQELAQQQRKLEKVAKNPAEKD